MEATKPSQILGQVIDHLNYRSASRFYRVTPWAMFYARNLTKVIKGNFGALSVGDVTRAEVYSIVKYQEASFNKVQPKQTQNSCVPCA